jgi:hypothetical protein
MYLAFTFFVFALFLASDASLRDISQHEKGLKVLGASNREIEKYTTTFTNFRNKYCDKNLTDEVKLKRIQRCRPQALTQIGRDLNVKAFFVECFDKVTKDVSVVRIRDMTCKKESQELDELNKQINICLKASVLVSNNKAEPSRDEDNSKALKSLRGVISFLENCYAELN